jgi:hypothetical protein
VLVIPEAARHRLHISSSQGARRAARELRADCCRGLGRGDAIRMRQIRRGSIRLSYDRCERGHQASPCGGHGHRQGRRQARTVCALPRPRRPGKMAPKASVSNEARRWADMCLASPSVISARALADDGAVIAATWSQRDVVTSKKRNFAITYGRVGDRAYAPTLPVQSSQSDEFLSPSGRRLVRFVDKNGDDGPTEVEVWSLGTGEGDGTCLEAVWTVAAKVHGPVFADEWFGGVAWSPSENLFVYVADRPHVSSFDDGKEGHSKPGRNTEADTWVDACRSKFDQASRDVLGEAYVNQRSPALFLGDVQRAACRALCLSIDDEPDVDDESQHLFGDPQVCSHARRCVRPRIQDRSIHSRRATDPRGAPAARPCSHSGQATASGSL